MKYQTIIETDDFEDFEFFKDGNGKYIHGIDAGAVNGEWIALYFTECKQESVLDKVRAEILKLDDAEYDFEGYYKAVTDALQVIDKYRESEDK